MRNDPMANPSSTPRATAIAKPARVRARVTDECSEIGPRYFCSEAAISDGLGSTNAGIVNAVQTNCHSSSRPRTNSQGSTASARLGLIRPHLDDIILEGADDRHKFRGVDVAPPR